MRTILLNLTIITASSLFALYFIEFSLQLFQLKHTDQDLALTTNSTCPSQDEFIKLHGIELAYSDGGFRNQDYTKSKKDYLKVWADTMCLKRHTYFDTRGLRKVSSFINQTYKINANGFRGDDWHNIQKKNITRIFLVGGSVAFSMHTNEPDSIHRLLEIKLNNQSALNSKKFKVYNAAMPGANANYEYNVLLKEILQHNPNIIVFLTGINNAGRKNNSTDNIKRIEYHNLFHSVLNDFFSFFQLKFLKRYIQINFTTIYANSSRESFLRHEIATNKICKENNIRCIFALQPTVLVERYILSDSEKKIKNQVYKHQKGIIAENYESDYQIYDNMFRDNSNEFEYINLSGLGSIGLFSGWIQSEQSKKLPTNPSRDAIQFISQNKNNSKLKLQVDLEKLELPQCNNALFYITSPNHLKSICQMNFFDKLNTLSTNNSSYHGYEKIMSSQSETPIILKFPLQVEMNFFKLNLILKNYANRHDIKLDSALSYDGINFGKNIRLTKSFTNGDFLLQWKLNKQKLNKALYIMLKFRNSKYIGIQSITYETQGKVPNLNITNKLDIKNNGDSAFLLIQKNLNQTKEIFVDAAHLTGYGNSLIADNLTKKIINK